MARGAGVSVQQVRNYEALGDPETHTRIQQYELAFRMQASVPEMTDLKSEPEAVRRSIGFLSASTGLYARLTPRETLTFFGALHGLNPGMGWLFAVALGIQRGERRAVWRALLKAADLGPLASASIA